MYKSRLEWGLLKGGKIMADVFDTFGDDVQYEYINSAVTYLANIIDRDDNFVLTKYRKIMIDIFNEYDIINLTSFSTLTAEKRLVLVTKSIEMILGELNLPREPHLTHSLKIYSNWKNKYNKN